MKKVIISLACILFASILVWVVISQIIKPIECKIKTIRCCKSDAYYECIEKLHEEYLSGELRENEQVIYSYNGTLPSQKAADYMAFYFDIEIKNRSFIEDYTVNAMFDSISNNLDRILFGYNSDQILPGYIFKRDSGGVSVMLMAYIGDMTEEQIKGMARSVQIKITTEGKYIGKRVKNMSSSSCDNILFE